jgi:hypothetical protein
VADLDAAVGQWSRVLGRGPTFVDAGRWAQFDLPSGRLCLAGSDRASESAGPMIKVDDLAQALARASEAGWACTAAQTGPHERRAIVTPPDGPPAVLYSPIASKT